MEAWVFVFALNFGVVTVADFVDVDAAEDVFVVIAVTAAIVNEAAAVAAVAVDAIDVFMLLMAMVMMLILLLLLILSMLLCSCW